MNIKFCFVFITCAVAVVLCSFNTHLRVKAEQDFIGFSVPSNFPKPVYNIRVSPDGFALGKLLFYESAISANGRVSCGSCHQASAAFANLNSAVSTGINNCKGTRNAPPLFNLAWQKTYMWDGRISKMNEVPINALTNPCEMGTTLENVVDKLKGMPYYPFLFNKAFGRSGISKENILNALSQFTAMLISANSRYDKIMRKEGNYAFSERELTGYLLFKEKCSSCHTEPLFTDQQFRNNGLEEQSTDQGRDSVTHRLADVGKFRVPSLRNVEITGPYMHDGRFYALKEVLKHYATGMKNHKNLDAIFKNQAKPGIALTEEAQLRIIDFLKTLTDVDLINDRRFNNH